MAFEHCGDLGKRGVFFHADGFAAHNLADGERMRLDIVGRACIRAEHIEPPGTAVRPILSADFLALGQIALADHADDMLVLIDDGRSADTVLHQ
ncbi:hypothetical protein P3T23_003118 [Paraburkholderia sp. GAS448]